MRVKSKVVMEKIKKTNLNWSKEDTVLILHLHPAEKSIQKKTKQTKKLDSSAFKLHSTHLILRSKSRHKQTINYNLLPL